MAIVLNPGDAFYSRLQLAVLNALPDLTGQQITDISRGLFFVIMRDRDDFKAALEEASCR